MPSIVAAVVLAVHGAIHLIGFFVPWQLATVEGFPYRTTLLAGLVDVGPAGIRAVGALWLLVAAGFVLAGFGVWRGEPWAVGVAAGLALGSLVLCVFGLPDAAAGIVVNVAILAAAAFLLVIDTGTTSLTSK